MDIKVIKLILFDIKLLLHFLRAENTLSEIKYFYNKTNIVFLKWILVTLRIL
jgi:hypothetical protein